MFRFGLVTEHHHYNTRPIYVSGFHVAKVRFFLAFSLLCTNSTFGHHPHTLGYLCAKFCFCRGIHCWARPRRKVVHSITQSLSLLDSPGTEAFASEKVMSHADKCQMLVKCTMQKNLLAWGQSSRCLATRHWPPRADSCGTFWGRRPSERCSSCQHCEGDQFAWTRHKHRRRGHCPRTTLWLVLTHQLSHNDMQ